MKKFLKELQKLEIILRTEIIESSESSKENLTNEISSFDPFSFIKNIFKTINFYLISTSKRSLAVITEL